MLNLQNSPSPGQESEKEGLAWTWGDSPGQWSKVRIEKERVSYHCGHKDKMCWSQKGVLVAQLPQDPLGQFLSGMMLIFWEGYAWSCGILRGAEQFTPLVFTNEMTVALPQPVIDSIR